MAGEDPEKFAADVATPPQASEPSYQHPSDQSWNLQFLLDLKASIAKLEERTDNQTSEMRAIRSEMIGKTAFWAAVSLIIAVMLGLASIYFSTQDSARLSKISPERHAPHQKGSGPHTSP